MSTPSNRAFTSSSSASAAPAASSSSTAPASSSAAMTPAARSAAQRTSLRTKYLIAYNLLSAGLWTAVLNRVATLAASSAAAAAAGGAGLDLDAWSAVGARSSAALEASSGAFVRWVQTAAALEVLHAAFGIVRAPVATTALQVLSRAVLVWAIVAPFPEVARGSGAYTTMLLAWSVTEVVRYSYFVLALAGQVPAGVVWLRYNLFFVLYPLGIGSETWLVYRAIPHAAAANPLLGYALYAVLAIYVPGSYVLYTHMMAQRRRVMRGKEKARE